jgi:hypothetical protein
MRRTRAALAAAAVLAASFTFSPFHASAEDPCERGTILNIVAHHDDDLLFLSPNLIHDIRDGKCVRTVFLIASDYPGNRPITNDEYMQERELGVRKAYAEAAGEDWTNWESAPYEIGENENAHQFTKWTLNDQVSIVELRISDNATPPGGALWYLYGLNVPVTTRAGTDNDPQTFDRDGLGRILRDLVFDFRPDQIHAGDPLGDHHGPTDEHGVLPSHPDHLATARLVRWALDGMPGGPMVEGYRDYTIQYASSNLSDEEIGAKTQIFSAFTEHDLDICHDGDRCPSDQWNELYQKSMSRQYYVDTEWRGGFIEPLPRPYADNPRPGPYLRDRFKFVNVATGLELAIENASDANYAKVITWNSTGTPNQKFEMRANVGGWEISALNTQTPGTDRWKCLELNESSKVNGAGVQQFDCRGTPNQALRLILQHDGNYELVFAHSDMRLTGGRNAGDQATQSYYEDDPAKHRYQLWRLVPA